MDQSTNNQLVVAIDLSTHKVGISIIEKETKTYIGSFFINDLCEGQKFQLLDTYLMDKCIDRLESQINYLPPQSIVLVEYSNIIGTVKYLAFCSGIIMGLRNRFPNLRIVALNQARWIALARKTFMIRRDTFPSTKKGEKDWLRAIALKHSHKPIKEQDCCDALVMGLTFLENENKL